MYFGLMDVMANSSAETYQIWNVMNDGKFSIPRVDHFLFSLFLLDFPEACVLWVLRIIVDNLGIESHLFRGCRNLTV